LNKLLGNQNCAGISKILKRNMHNVLIDTTNICNLRCIFCTRNNRQSVGMTTHEFETILSRFQNRIGSLQLSCAWEYSVSKDATEIVRVLGKFNIPFTTIYTNGNILPDDLARAIIGSGLNNFVISIGEARKETYERIRKGGNFEHVLANIRKLGRMKKERNCSHPRLCVNMTLINSNINELPEFVDLAHDLGIVEIRGRHLILNEGLDISSERITDYACANSILEFAGKKASGYGMSFSVPKFLDQTLPKACRAPWQQLYISSNGDVSVCPRIHRYIKVGNLLREDLRNVLRSREMINLKKQFRISRFENPVCEICLANRETEIPIDQGF
jgi:radical SAM protein with 4Fe4S-binding SPASM domain